MWRRPLARGRSRSRICAWMVDVERGGRLVRDQQFRFAGQCGRDRRRRWRMPARQTDADTASGAAPAPECPTAASNSTLRFFAGSGVKLEMFLQGLDQLGCRWSAPD